MKQGFVEAVPRRNVTLADCHFYHSVDLPGLGRQPGQWDLIGRFDEYVGYQDLSGATVLDVGTATGFLTFEAERRGATVTSFDVRDAEVVSYLPIAGTDYVDDYAAWKVYVDAYIERMKNSYWLCHHAFGSSATCLYGDVYELDPSVGVFDVVMVGQILIHLRDGISALAAAASVCRDRMIIVEGSFPDDTPIARLAGRADRPDVAYAWYQYSEGWYREILTMLGFSDISISTSIQRCSEPSHESEIELTTIAARR
jgi:SAM-dependent methyltransferase